MGKWIKDKFFPAILFGMSVAFGTAVVVLSIYADGVPDKDKPAWAMAAGAGAFFTVVVGFGQNHLAERRKDRAQERAVWAEVHLRRLYGDTLVPLTLAVRDMCAAYRQAAPAPTHMTPGLAAEIAARRSEILDIVLRHAVGLTAALRQPPFIPEIRCSFYVINSSDRFELVRSFPGYKMPRSPIDAVGSAHMKHQILLPGKPFWIDGVTHKYSYLVPPSGDYKGVIAVPVKYKDRDIGILAIDGPRYEDFIPEHVKLMEALANMLASSYVFE